jgi:hypothetical protein
MELNFCTRKVFGSYRINLLVDPVDFTFEHCNSPKDKVLFLDSIRIARLIDVEQVHNLEIDRNRAVGKRR